ncbi:hypothetical protein Tco_0411301 [Tanacetum coccineum]
MNEQSHYKQDQTKTRQSINVKSHIFNVREDNDKSKQTPTRMSSVKFFKRREKDLQDNNVGIEKTITKEVEMMVMIKSKRKCFIRGDQINSLEIAQSRQMNTESKAFKGGAQEPDDMDLGSKIGTREWIKDVDVQKTMTALVVFAHSWDVVLTSWFSKKQTALAISTTEAEYVSAGKACQQALWMKQALIDYGIRLDNIPIMCDNKGAIDLSKNPVQHSSNLNTLKFATTLLRAIVHRKRSISLRKGLIGRQHSRYSN